MSLLGALRRASDALLALALVLALAAAALWWWSGTPGSLAWAWQRWAAPQGVQAQGLTGSLRGGLRATQLIWSRDGLHLALDEVDIAWQPLDLLRGRLHLAHLRAQALRVDDQRPPAPSAPPLALTLPLAVAIDELTLGRLAWQGAAAFEASALSAHYRYERREHHLKLRNAVVARGRYSGQASLGDLSPLPLQATLRGEVDTQAPRGGAPLTLSFNAQVAGTLAALDLRAQLRALGTGGTTAPPREPSATLTARLAPWQAHPLAQAQAQMQHLDLAALWPGAPHTDLGGRIELAPETAKDGAKDAAPAWNLAVDLTNGHSGPWDRAQLPLSRLQAQGQWRAGTALVRHFDAQVGGGRIEGRGQWLAADRWQAQARVQGVDPAALHGALATGPLSGRLQAQGQGAALDFDLALRAAATGATGPREPQALALRQLQARGRWQDGRLDLRDFTARSDDAALVGQLAFTSAPRAGQGRLTLTAPGLSAQAEGTLAADRGEGRMALQAPQLATASAWLQRLPGVSLPAAAATLDGGNARVDLTWRGGWLAPTLQARAQGAATQGSRRLRLDLAGEAGRQGDAWQGRLDNLHAGIASAAPEWSLQLQRPLAWRLADSTLETGAGSALLAAPATTTTTTTTAPAPISASASASPPARITWDPVRWGGGQLRSAGRITGLPLAWLALAGGVPPTGDLVFDAQWDAHLADTLRLRAQLVRASGDLTLLAETAEGAPVRVSAGVREARLTLDSAGEAVTLKLRWDSERAGTLEGELGTRLARGGPTGWHWPEAAPLAGRLQAQLPRMGVWSLLAPPGWRLRGSLAADLALAGTRAAPRLQGPLRADDLGLRSVVDGVALQDGRLRARLDDRRLVIDELLLQGAGGGGQLRASGEGAWTAQGPQLQLEARLEQLRASVRSDRQVTVSGRLTGRVDRRLAELTGDLRVDRARLTLPDRAAPQLGDDVIVRNLPPGVRLGPGAPRTDRAPGARPLRVAVNLDLGDDVRVQGHGATARLRGALAVTATEIGEPRLTGTVQAVDGEYRAYGQALVLERAVLRFTGPPDNPALDVLAVRPHLLQKVGVLVTGRAQAPTVRLYAEPDLPDAEKLSWLVLGRAAPAGGAEAALVQQAAVSLLAQRAGMGGGLAGRLGLDELSVRREGSSGAAITLGKRFANNFYAAYERSLAGALGTLRVFYDLTRHLTLRAEAGDRSGVDLIYTLTYD